MRRRELVALGLGLLHFPAFAYAQRTDLEEAEARSALARAEARRGLLAVFIVPSDREAALHRGRQLGAFLMHGPQDALTALGFAEVTCVRMSTLRAWVPGIPEGDAELVVIDTVTSPHAVTTYVGPLPAPFEWAPEPSDPEDEAEAFSTWRREQSALEEASIDADIAAVTALVLRAFRPAFNAASASERSEALLRTRALLQLEVSGSVWAFDAGCGLTLEHPPPPRPDRRVIQLGELCGMGHVPERAERFLYFYSLLEE